SAHSRRAHRRSALRGQRDPDRDRISGRCDLLSLDVASLRGGFRGRAGLLEEGKERSSRAGGEGNGGRCFTKPRRSGSAANGGRRGRGGGTRSFSLIGWKGSYALERKLQ